MNRSQELAPTAPVDTRNESGFNTPKRAAGFVGGALAIALVTGALVGQTTGNERNASEASADGSGAEACDGSVFSKEVTRVPEYADGSFLPKGEAPIAKDKVTETVRSWFNQGPLGGKLDTASLAAVTAVIVKPAHDGQAVTNNPDYSGDFKGALATYETTEGGLATARKACKTASDTLNQTGEFDESWAEGGEVVTKIVPVRDNDNSDVAKRRDVIGMNFEPQTTTSTLSGIAFELRKSSEGLDGFPEVLVNSTDSALYVKGITQGQTGTILEDGPADIPREQRDAANAGGSGEQSGQGQGEANTGGAAGPNGDNPEAGPGGVTASPGGGGGGEGTPAPGPGPDRTPDTSPPRTSPPRTNPPTTSPPRTTPPTQPPRTTPPPTKPPINCDPNIDNC